MGDHEIELHGTLGLPDWAGFGVRVEAKYKGTWARRTQELTESVQAISGLSREELIERLLSDDRYRDAFALAGARVTQVGDHDYRSALGGLLAGALDDARIDEVAFLLSQIARLEPLHLRVLFAACAFWGDRERDRTSMALIRVPPNEAVAFKASGLNAGQIAERLGVPPALVDIAVAALSAAGLLNGAAALTEWGIRAIETIFPDLSYADHPGHGVPAQPR